MITTTDQRNERDDFSGHGCKFQSVRSDACSGNGNVLYSRKRSKAHPGARSGAETILK
ncbi:hypothetical protein BTIS_0835 [Bifidobacterium tissieri]|uniref:Uncharacterized protein n=1 Tax=Bifidobacterium tissieri TaxID=1630162 RepID=A0A261FHW8_9BIFI|nr:hypothetical protein [Bifidobacterium tissieri]OZG58466.1 hypothetical protein BTIS_0835 [Bifidobacterium tissieri]